MNINHPNLTICICTFNRAKSLERTLESIAKLSVPDELHWEVIVVDNNSIDETKTTACRLMAHLPLRYMFETNQGLSHARNRAIKECRGDFLIFTDDDVHVESSWVREFFAAAEHFPDADYFGGRVLPYWLDGRPMWLKDCAMDLIGGLLVHYDLGIDLRLYSQEDPTPIGANFAIRRRLFENLKPFRTDLGVRGFTPGRGEESEYLSRARAHGFKGVYVGAAVCHHFVDPVRLNLGYMYRYGIQTGITEFRLNSNRNPYGSFFKELLFGIKGIAQLLKGRGDRFRQCVINMGIQRGLRLSERESRTTS
jgi:glycosyltransferase involved in cell wall biosynthesis